VQMAPYWPDDQEPWKQETPLLAADIGSASRLSAFDFGQQFGFDLDLVEHSLHLFATERATPDLVLPETIWRQRLRGVAAEVYRIIETSRAAVVFVPHGAEVISRIIAEVASARKCRILFWESGFFPGYLYLDASGPHFFRGAARIDSLPQPSRPSPRARAFRDVWQRNRRSKYPQNEAHHPRLTQWLAGDTRPVLFLAGQVPTDANAVVGLGPFETLGDLYGAALAYVPEQWRVLYKPHPFASHDPLIAPPLPSERFLSLDIDVHEAIRASDAVLVHSSNVGLEALLLGKPVLALGRPIYAERGLTVDLPSPEALGIALTAGPPLPPARRDVEAFLDLVLDEALIADGDAAALLRRFEQAMPGAHQESRRAFYGTSVGELADAARAIHQSLCTCVRLDRALEATAPRQVELLDRRIGLDVLEPHRFGGPIVPRRLYAPRPMPDLDVPLGGQTIYSDLRLEECVDPVTAIAAHVAPGPGDACVFQVATTSNADTECIQGLGLPGFTAAVKLALPDLEISCFEWRNSHEADWIVIAAPPATPLHGVASALSSPHYRRWTLPADAFEVANDVIRRPGSYDLGQGSSAHPSYGPYIHIPGGRWKATWAQAPFLPLTFLEALSRLISPTPLAMEVVAHGDDRCDIVGHAPFSQSPVEFLADNDSRYEFRTKRTGSRKQNRCFSAPFRGLILSPADSLKR